jgi:hypothetical protein
LIPGIISTNFYSILPSKTKVKKNSIKNHPEELF